MIYELFSFFFELLSLMYNIGMFLRELPPLALDVGLVLIVGLCVTKLKPPKEGFRLPAAGKCIAHRGAAFDAPENTMAAFKYCVDKGCKYIEFDVRTTKDGVPVVFHDSKLQGVAISASTWDQIKDIPVARGDPMEDKYPDAKLCTLEEALNYLNSKGVSSIIDMKSWDVITCTAVARHFSQNPTMYYSCMVTSFNPIAVYRVRKIDPNIVTGLAYHPRCFSASSFSIRDPIRHRFPDSIVKHYFARFCDHLHGILWWNNMLTAWAGCSIVVLHKDVTSPWIIMKWQNRGYDVVIWGVNQPVEKRMAAKQFGVPYITDTLVGEDLVNGFIK